jgi:isocitrate dehydrogenase
MDVVIIRENEEDLYAGIEHQQTQEVVQCLKLITKPGSENIIRYAFEYAKAHNRKKVTCMVKDNIMKLTDGLFHNTFKEIAKEYPSIESNSQIIDIGSARLAAKPENYDVVVTSNLYGDIISDIVAEISGSVGLAGSANIGKKVAMFEAIHGSAPDIAGQNIANPSGLINAAVMMLAHIGQKDVAENIKNAWLATIEDGIHTSDIFNEDWSKKHVGTDEFADAIIERLGSHPKVLAPSTLSKSSSEIKFFDYKRVQKTKELVGVDVFLDWQESNPEKLGNMLSELKGTGMVLKMITNRGVKVYPNGFDETFSTDHWRCRFVSDKSDIKAKVLEYKTVDKKEIITLLTALLDNNFDVIKTENLYNFDGKRGFSLGQGE